MFELAFLTLPFFNSAASEWQTARRGAGSVLVYKAAAGTGTRPILSIECRQGVTSLTVYWHQLVGAPIAQPVTYAIDHQPPSAQYWRRTADARSVGLWGESSISLGQRLVGKSQLIVYARARSGEILHAQFKLGGLDHAIAPVAQACRWRR
jgi:type VI secretion system VasI family protein